ncbi:unnamed protein product [Periconia digitata]|uniref:Uncharacterized protein n=1 Tax=Periconia digitata TaxID=1303443 RepID=A0A9W4XNC7_9PLEO|nr:unnamed protein product [Periconia digitata]
MSGYIKYGLVQNTGQVVQAFNSSSNGNTAANGGTNGPGTGTTTSNGYIVNPNFIPCEHNEGDDGQRIGQITKTKYGPGKPVIPKFRHWSLEDPLGRGSARTVVENTVSENTVMEDTGVKNTAFENTIDKNIGFNNHDVKNTAVKHSGVKNAGVGKTRAKNTGVKKIGSKNSGTLELAASKLALPTPGPDLSTPDFSTGSKKASFAYSGNIDPRLLDCQSEGFDINDNSDISK